MYSFRSPTIWTKSVAFGEAIFTENISGPSQVVATRRSVDLVRMYSSISGAMGIDKGFFGIAERFNLRVEIGFIPESPGFYPCDARKMQSNREI
jgi:hypothetical protein